MITSRRGRLRPVITFRKFFASAKCYAGSSAGFGHKQTYANFQPDVISPLFIMQIPELAPLLEKVEVLKQAPGAEDVYAFVEASVMGAKTPAMGQSACEKVIMMCHPRAWGDRHVPAFSKTWTDWCSYLGDLRDMAASCGQQIHERYAKHR
jgi:hypothetical protein